jgi:hypothetical protein
MKFMLMIITGENNGEIQDIESPTGRLCSVKHDDFFIPIILSEENYEKPRDNRERLVERLSTLLFDGILYWRVLLMI